MKKFISTSIIISSLFSSTFLLNPEITEAKSTKFDNLFYYFPSQAAYKSLTENYKNIDILAPQLYTLDGKYNLSKPASTDAIDFAKKNKIDVMPLVYNEGFSKQLMREFLANTKAQDKFITQLVREAQRKKFVGWQFDFENINYLDRDAYTAFVAKASKAFKKKKLDFSVAVIPRRNDFDPYAATQDWSSAYNIGEISKHVDFVSVMAYDDPISRGPVASMPYVDAVINHTLKTTPASKISLGIPFYCWQWELNQNKKIANIPYSMTIGTETTYKNNNYKRSFSKTEGAENITFTKDNGERHSIWCDNYESVAAKISYAKKKGFIGTSAWALGQEDPKVWNEFK
jgi:spore germination protein YaaH